MPTGRLIAYKPATLQRLTDEPTIDFILAVKQRRWFGLWQTDRNVTITVPLNNLDAYKKHWDTLIKTGGGVRLSRE